MRRWPKKLLSLLGPVGGQDVSAKHRQVSRVSQGMGKTRRFQYRLLSSKMYDVSSKFSIRVKYGCAS